MAEYTVAIMGCVALVEHSGTRGAIASSRKAPRIPQAPCWLLAIPPYGLIVGWVSIFLLAHRLYRFRVGKR